MEQLLYRADEVSRLLNIGRSKAYLMMASGELPVVRIGRSVRVPSEGLRRWVETRSSAIASGELATSSDLDAVDAEK